MMNKDKLKQFVNALDTLSDDVKDWGVNMGSGKKPTCGTPGWHAGLIAIVAKGLPELQEIYENHIYFSEGCGNERDYHYSLWADALAEFLGFVDLSVSSALTNCFSLSLFIIFYSLFFNLLKYLFPVVDDVYVG
jgi:hypothetical protein